jgi:peptidoglycan/LPS O-acetylase OafA/YrhL
LRVLPTGTVVAVLCLDKEAVMKAIRRAVVAALLAVWCFPAVSLAKSEPPAPAPVVAQTTAPRAPAASAGTAAESESLAAREQKAPDLQDFKGGAAVVYIGGTTLLVILLIILLV